jgi:hypothetical protein
MLDLHKGSASRAKTADAACLHRPHRRDALAAWDILGTNTNCTITPAESGIPVVSVALPPERLMVSRAPSLLPSLSQARLAMSTSNCLGALASRPHVRTILAGNGSVCCCELWKPGLRLRII